MDNTPVLSIAGYCRISVDEELDRDNTSIENQKAIIEEKLPYTIGGGIGQSRICMFFLRKAHIGEVQASIWPDGVRAEAEAHNIHLL